MKMKPKEEYVIDTLSLEWFLKKEQGSLQQVTCIILRIATFNNSNSIQILIWIKIYEIFIFKENLPRTIFNHFALVQNRTKIKLIYFLRHLHTTINYYRNYQ